MLRHRPDQTRRMMGYFYSINQCRQNPKVKLPCIPPKGIRENKSLGFQSEVIPTRRHTSAFQETKVWPLNFRKPCLGLLHSRQQNNHNPHELKRALKAKEEAKLPPLPRFLKPPKEEGAKGKMLCFFIFSLLCSKHIVLVPLGFYYGFFLPLPPPP